MARTWYVDSFKQVPSLTNQDDGTHSIACEKCGVWQHSACHGIRESEAESDDFHFVCASCRRPKTNTFKIRLSSSASPQNEKRRQANGGSEAPFILPTSETSDPAIVKPRSVSSAPRSHAYTNGENLSNAPRNSVDTVRRVTPLSSPPRGHFSNGPSPVKPSVYANGLSPHGQRSRGLSPALAYTHAHVHYPQHTPSLGQISHQRPYSPSPGSAMRAGTASPTRTPSLSATQGQTSIRFSPTASPGGHLTNSYSPVLNQPSAAALSPTKQPTSSPPPQQPSLSPTQGQTSVRFSPVPNYPQNGTPSYIPNPRPVSAAVSPTKRASPSPPPPPPRSSVSVHAPEFEFATPSIRGPSGMGIMGSAMSLNEGMTPTLSPSVNAAMEIYETPMKRSFSGGAPPM